MKEVREIQRDLRRIQQTVADLKMEGDTWEDLRVALRKWERGPWLTASKETGISVLQTWWTEFCQQQGWAWQWIFPQRAQKSTQPNHHLVIAWTENSVMLCQTSDPQNCEIINGCYFKMLCDNLLCSNGKLIYYVSVNETKNPQTFLIYYPHFSNHV